MFDSKYKNGNWSSAFANTKNKERKKESKG
jgi:hypothetical protein